MARAKSVSTSPLTPDQQAHAELLEQKILQAVRSDIQAIAQQLATTTDKTIFGHNEFVIRDLVHGLGAKAIETALNERKKGGT
jgi:hypothetical protein